jgi:lysophospholipase L1-like esterase
MKDKKKMKRIKYFFIAIIIFISIGVTKLGTPNELKPEKEKWVGTWATSLQAPFEEGISQQGFKDQTIRSIVHPDISGEKLRIRISNVYGSKSLRIEEIHVAVSKNGPEIFSSTDKSLKFSGKENVVIPPGKRKLSDPIRFDFKKGSNLSISMYIRNNTGPVTWHPRSIQTTYISSDNHVNESSSSVFGHMEEAWFFLDAVDVLPDSSVKGALVVVGDSIANGNHSIINANHRWPDYLAKRLNLKKSPIKMSVLNAGITANHIINDAPESGENAFGRLQRDVFSQAGVRGVIFHQGLNDIRHYPDYNAEKIIDRMIQIIDSTHSEGLKIYGGTLTPFKGSGMYSEARENTRQKVNSWIRTSEEFDGVIDFDKAIRDPEDPERILTDYDAGDHFHPNDKGYEKMAETIDLSMFE